MKAIILFFILSTLTFGQLKLDYVDQLTFHFHNNSETNLVVSHLLDAGFSQMKTLGYAPFTQAYIDNMYEKAFKFGMEQFGYNISFNAPGMINNYPMPGMRVLLNTTTFTPLFVCADFFENETRSIHVALNTDDLSMGKKPGWIQLVWNVLCIAQTTTIAPGGRKAGSQFIRNDAFAHGISVYLNYGSDLNKDKNLEVWEMWTPRVGKHLINEWGNVEYKIVLNVRRPSDGKICKYFDLQERDSTWDEFGINPLRTRMNYDGFLCPTDTGVYDPEPEKKRYVREYNQKKYYEKRYTQQNTYNFTDLTFWGLPVPVQGG